ncbi:MAG: hypothetical protein IPK73_20300 [Candidatus Obscuribacter sp.]|nr:hypothetical protein [Candidatus Obscuribacter sp.]MBK9278025.1 hypothetical protein [Candidatus Obscuribacter sp.]
MFFWEDLLTEQFQDWRDGLKTSSPSFLDQNKQDQEEASARHLEWLKENFFAESDESKLSQALRSVLSVDGWYVKTQESGEPLHLEQVPEQFKFFPYTDLSGLAKAESKGGKSRETSPKYRPVKEAGVSYLVLHRQESHSSTLIPAGEIVKYLPAKCGGILFYMEAEDAGTKPLFLPEKYLERLKSLTEAMQVEHYLVFPGGAGAQLETLLKHHWQVEVRGGEIVKSSIFSDLKMVLAATHKDKCPFSETMIMSGQDLFAWVAEQDDVDGLAVNVVGKLESGGRPVNNLVMAPGIVHALSRGIDIRAGAAPLPARSLKEVEHYLKQVDFPWKDRRFVEAVVKDDSGQEVVLLRAVVEGASTWRIQDSQGGQLLAHEEGLTWSPVFQLPLNYKQVKGFGEGKTKILCAGHLATELGARSYRAEDINYLWRPGRFLLLGRLLDEQDRRSSQHRMEVAGELLKLLDGQDRIPRSAILTVEGAKTFSLKPFTRGKQWLEASLKRAEQFTGAFAWGVA